MESITVYENVEGSGGARYERGLLPTSNNEVAIPTIRKAYKDFPESCEVLPKGAFQLFRDFKA